MATTSPILLPSSVVFVHTKSVSGKPIRILNIMMCWGEGQFKNCLAQA